MKKAVIYTRVSGEPGLDRDGQREKLLAKFGKEYKIVGEGHDVGERHKHGQDRTGLKTLLEDAAKGQFDVLLCTDASRLLGSISPEIIGAMQKAGVQIMSADGTQIGFADLVANTLINQIPMTEVEARSQRIKRGIRAAKSGATRKRQPPQK